MAPSSARGGRSIGRPATDRFSPTRLERLIERRISASPGRHDHREWLLIIVAVWIATLLDARKGRRSWWSTVAASCFSSRDRSAIIHSLLRWENAESAYEKERSSAELVVQAISRELHSDSTRTTTVLSHMTDGILMLSPATEIVLINDAARWLLALPADGVYLGRKFSELVRVCRRSLTAVNETTGGEQSIEMWRSRSSMVRQYVRSPCEWIA